MTGASTCGPPKTTVLPGPYTIHSHIGIFHLKIKPHHSVLADYSRRKCVSYGCSQDKLFWGVPLTRGLKQLQEAVLKCAYELPDHGRKNVDLFCCMEYSESNAWRFSSFRLINMQKTKKNCIYLPLNNTFQSGRFSLHPVLIFPVMDSFHEYFPVFAVMPFFFCLTIHFRSFFCLIISFHAIPV